MSYTRLNPQFESGTLTRSSNANAVSNVVLYRFGKIGVLSLAVQLRSTASAGATVVVATSSILPAATTVALAGNEAGKVGIAYIYSNGDVGIKPKDAGSQWLNTTLIFEVSD